MSVLVKGMKMPKSCGRCWFNNSSLSCAITGSCIDRDDENGDRLDDCPIVELPDKHGRLVDADESEKYFWEHLDDNGMAGAMNAINEMPTIVESEDSE